MIATGMTNKATLRSEIARERIMVLGGDLNLRTIIIEIITRMFPIAVSKQSKVSEIAVKIVRVTPKKSPQGSFIVSTESVILSDNVKFVLKLSISPFRFILKFCSSFKNSTSMKVFRLNIDLFTLFKW